jgi:hypothetical protein
MLRNSLCFETTILGKSNLGLIYFARKKIAAKKRYVNAKVFKGFF